MRSSVVASRSSSQLERIARLQPFSRSCAERRPDVVEDRHLVPVVDERGLVPAGQRDALALGGAAQRLGQHLAVAGRGACASSSASVVVGVQQALGVLRADVRRERVAHAAEPVGERAVAVERDPVAHARSSIACSMGSARRRSRGSTRSSATTRASTGKRTRDVHERAVREPLEESC